MPISSSDIKTCNAFFFILDNQNSSVEVDFDRSRLEVKLDFGHVKLNCPISFDTFIISCCTYVCTINKAFTG